MKVELLITIQGALGPQKAEKIKMPLLCCQSLTLP